MIASKYLAPSWQKECTLFNDLEILIYLYREVVDFSLDINRGNKKITGSLKMQHFACNFFNFLGEGHLDVPPGRRYPIPTNSPPAYTSSISLVVDILPFTDSYVSTPLKGNLFANNWHEVPVMVRALQWDTYWTIYASMKFGERKVNLNLPAL